MANTAPTITLDRRGATRVGRGLKCLTGKIVLCANSTHQTSAIEKFFRRCNDIKVTVQNAGNTLAVLPTWEKSTTNGNGILRTYAWSAKNEAFSGNIASLAAVQSGLSPFGIACSGTFVAFGS